MSVCQFVHLATCWSVHLSVSDWLSEMRVCVCPAAGARGLASGWRGMERAEPPMPSAPRSALYSSWTNTLDFILSRRTTSACYCTLPWVKTGSSKMCNRSKGLVEKAKNSCAQQVHVRILQACGPKFCSLSNTTLYLLFV